MIKKISASVFIYIIFFVLSASAEERFDITPDLFKLKLYVSVQCENKNIESILRSKIKYIISERWSGYFVFVDLKNITEPPDFSIEILVLDVGDGVFFASYLVRRYWEHSPICDAIDSGVISKELFEPLRSGGIIIRSFVTSQCVTTFMSGTFSKKTIGDSLRNFIEVAYDDGLGDAFFRAKNTIDEINKKTK